MTYVMEKKAHSHLFIHLFSHSNELITFEDIKAIVKMFEMKASTSTAGSKKWPKPTCFIRVS